MATMIAKGVRPVYWHGVVTGAAQLGPSARQSPEPQFAGAPDMIPTRVQSTRPLPSGVGITSEPQTCSRATVGSSGPNGDLRRRFAIPLRFQTRLLQGERTGGAASKASHPPWDSRGVQRRGVMIEYACS